MEAADKQWFEELFKSQQKQSDRRFDQIEVRFEQIDRKFEQIDLRFKEVDERIEKVETSLLTEFHKWASPLDARMRTHTALLRAVDLELEAHDGCIQKLENKN